MSLPPSRADAATTPKAKNPGSSINNVEDDRQRKKRKALEPLSSTRSRIGDDRRKKRGWGGIQFRNRAGIGSGRRSVRLPRLCLHGFSTKSPPEQRYLRYLKDNGGAEPAPPPSLIRRIPALLKSCRCGFEAVRRISIHLAQAWQPTTERQNSLIIGRKDSEVSPLT